MQAATEWASFGKDPDMLWQGARLAEIEEWAKQHGDDLPETAKEFLAASLSARNEALGKERKRQQADLATAELLREAAEERTLAERLAKETELNLSRRRKRLGLIVVLLSTIGPSSAYYVGGSVESLVGKSAPWLILIIMLSSCAKRALFLEAHSIFGKGDFFTAVREAFGISLAKIGIFALLFDYLLIAAISLITAGSYLVHLINEIATFLHLSVAFSPPYSTMAFCLIVSIFLWRKQLTSKRKEGREAFRIRAFGTGTVMTLVGLTLTAWCVVTLFTRGYYQPVPQPTSFNILFASEALGWLKGTAAPPIAAITILIGLGHSMLAMSDDQSLTRVGLAASSFKLESLPWAVSITLLNSFIFPILVSFFLVMLIPDAERRTGLDHPVQLLCLFLVGPQLYRLVFQAVITVVGAFVLVGAASSVMVGLDVGLETAVEAGVFTGYFQHVHPKHGTTHRLVHFLMILQLLLVVISQGDVGVLISAFAFGFGWSFTLLALALLALRYRMPESREWKMPLNLQVAGRELPVGLAVVATSLFLLAGINLLTKKVATISGLSFTLISFITFDLVGRYYRRKGFGNQGANRSN